MCYYFDDIIKIEDFKLDYISINEKSYENVLVYSISFKKLIAKPLRIKFDTIETDLLEFTLKLDMQYYLEMKNMIQFKTEFDILQA